jgi:hypothetical protein
MAKQINTVESRKKVWLDLAASYRTFAANATDEADRKKWTERAEDAERNAIASKSDQ